MKKILLSLLVMAILVSCQKGNDLASNKSTSPEDNAVPAKPTASFKVTNSFTNGTANINVRELQTLAIENTSINAVSYHWDFDSGAFASDGDNPVVTSSTSKVPADFYFAPCQRTVTITLTATNSAGESSNTSQSFFIQCSRLGAPH